MTTEPKHTTRLASVLEYLENQHESAFKRYQSATTKDCIQANAATSELLCGLILDVRKADNTMVELLEALESLFDEIDARGYHNDFTSQRALIAKARGQV